MTQAASCPRLFSCYPARMLPHCPTPTPSSPKLLIPDSCLLWLPAETRKEGDCVISLQPFRPPPPPDSLVPRKAPPLQFSKDGQFLEWASLSLSP